MSRIVDFSDGFETNTPPDDLVFHTTGVKSFADVAAFETYKGSSAELGDIFYDVSTSTYRFYNGANWISFANSTNIRAQGVKSFSNVAGFETDKGSSAGLGDIFYDVSISAYRFYNSAGWISFANSANLRAQGIKSFANTAGFETDKGSASVVGDLWFNTTLNSLIVNNNGGQQTIPITDTPGKGAIIVGDANSKYVAKSVGTDTYIPMADSTDATGIKWTDRVPKSSTPYDGGGQLTLYSGTFTASTNLSGNAPPFGSLSSTFVLSYIRVGSRMTFWGTFTCGTTGSPGLFGATFSLPSDLFPNNFTSENQAVGTISARGTSSATGPCAGCVHSISGTKLVQVQLYLPTVQGYTAYIHFSATGT